MLNRRHLRVKVLQSLYAHFQSDEQNYVRTSRDLFASIDRIYDLYIYFLLSMGELKSFAERRIAENKNKIRPTKEDITPNLKWVNNIIVHRIENSYQIQELSKDRKINWVGDDKQEIIRKMFLHIRESETYFIHMNNNLSGFEADKEFALDIFKEEIANFPLLYNYFEEQHIDWLDDIDLACNMVLKTIKDIEPHNTQVRVLTLYKDEENEKEFVNDLLRKTIAMNSDNEQLITELTSNWDIERIAKIDVLLLKMAITELQICPTIPTKVTLNEYIEISKFYSTPKSPVFINGILDKAIITLQDQEKIVKIGRGIVS